MSSRYEDVYIRLTEDFQLHPGVTKWFICLQLSVSAGAAMLIKLEWTKDRSNEASLWPFWASLSRASENLSILILVFVTVSISGRQLERVERVVSVHVRLRETAQQRVHGARTQARRTPLRRGGASHRQLHGRPVHTEWVTVIKKPASRCVFTDCVLPHLLSLLFDSVSSIMINIITALITATLIHLHHPSPRLWHTARIGEWRSKKATLSRKKLEEIKSKTVTFPSLQIENCFMMPKHRVSSPWTLPTVVCLRPWSSWSLCLQ